MIGLSMARGDERVMVMNAEGGKVESVAYIDSLESVRCEPRDHTSMFEEEMHGAKKNVKCDALTSKEQLVATSTAFLYIRSRFYHLDLFRSAVKLALHFRSGLQDCSLWDLGLRCNIPITPAQLNMPGVSFIIDASDDKYIFESMNTAIKWWQERFDVLVAQAPLEDIDNWNGHKIHLSALNEHRYENKIERK
jgi:hypothetical protein